VPRRVVLWIELREHPLKLVEKCAGEKEPHEGWDGGIPWNSYQNSCRYPTYKSPGAEKMGGK